jgi:hypothetical protein
MGLGSAEQRYTLHRARDTEPLAIPAIPTISCINIGRIPQVLGRDRAMWYLASASFDRHT